MTTSECKLGQDLLRPHAALSQMPDAQGIVAFGEADSGWVADEFAMKIVWRRVGEGANQQELAGGGFEEVGAADYFGDVHGLVVDHDCELVGGDVVAAPDEEVSEVVAGGVALGA